jgi:hypothetical protein
MYGDLKIAFVQKALADYMAGVIAAMRRKIMKTDARVTDELLNSFAFQTFQRDAEGNANLSFSEWGRFIDMGFGRGHPLGGIQATSDTLKEKSGRKPNKIYSPIAYGKLDGLIGDLMYGFTEETIAVLKQQIEGNNVSSQPG